MLLNFSRTMICSFINNRKKKETPDPKKEKKKPNKQTKNNRKLCTVETVDKEKMLSTAGYLLKD